MKHVFLVLPTACLAACLAACTTPPPLATNCPNVAVLEQGSALTAFLPGRQDVAAQIVQAKITGVAGSCTLERKKKQRGELTVAFQAGFAATNGPANTSQTLVLPYLISMSQGDTILSVSYGNATFDFSGNASTASATTGPLKYKFPNTPETSTIDLLVSFHLTQDQLAYNAAHPQP